MSIKPYEVTTSKIATKAVTNEKIADRAIDSRTIKDGAVTPDKLSMTVVTRPISPPIDSNEIKDGAVNTAEIAGNAVTADKIAPNSVTTEKIQDNAVTRDKIRDGSVTREKMADGIIGTAEIIDGSITNAKIAANTITGAKIAANAVGSSEIAANSVGYSEIAPQSLEPRSIKTISGAPPTPGQVPAYDESQGNLWWFRWANAATRPLTPQVATAEIADGAVTQEKLAPGVGGSRIVFLPTRLQLTSLIVSGNQVWQPSAPNPSIPPEATALILQVELVQQSIPPPPSGGWLNCRLRRDATQTECYAIGVEARNVGQIYGGQTVVPIVNGSFEYSFTEAYGNISITFNPYIVGYVV